MLKFRKSFKFKILGIIFLSFSILVGLVPVIINKTIDSTVSEYEKKSSTDLKIVFNAFLRSHYGSLTSQMTNWFSTSAAEEVENEEPDWEKFKNNLLGIGNSINSSHGVLGISVFDLDVGKVFDYNIEKDFTGFDSQSEKLKNIILLSKKNESKASGEIISKDGTPLLVLVIPSEDEDEEINYFHVYFMHTKILIENFSKSILLPTALSLKEKRIISNSFGPFAKLFEKEKKGIYFSIDKKNYKQRKASIRPEMWDGKAGLNVIVDMTSLQSEIKKIEYSGLAIIIATIFILLAFIYTFLTKIVKSFISKVKVLNEVANESMEISYLLKCSSEEGFDIAESEALEVSSTSSAAEEISQTLRSSQDSAKACVEVANESRETATHGGEVIEKMIREIGEVGKMSSDFMGQVQIGNEKITKIADTLEKISEKSKDINDIVFQTKLLSFNASVEAARAGEHGKGFAVVAEEVGNLAQHSGKISSEINSIVESSVVEVKRVIDEILETTKSSAEKNSEKIKSASSVGVECKNSLERILKCSTQVDESIAQISAATGEQSIAVGEIANSVRKIEGLSYQNKHAANQNKDFSVKMKNQVDRVLDNAKQMMDLLLGESISEAKGEKPIDDQLSNIDSKDDQEAA